MCTVTGLPGGDHAQAARHCQAHVVNGVVVNGTGGMLAETCRHLFVGR